MAQVLRVLYFPSPSYELYAKLDVPRLGGAASNPVMRVVKNTSLAVVGPAEIGVNCYNLTQVGRWWRMGEVCATRDFPVSNPVTTVVKKTSLTVVAPTKMRVMRYNLTQGTVEIFVMRTNVARRNVAWTNVTVIVGIYSRCSQEPTFKVSSKLGQ